MTKPIVPPVAAKDASPRLTTGSPTLDRISCEGVVAGAARAEGAAERGDAAADLDQRVQVTVGRPDSDDGVFDVRRRALERRSERVEVRAVVVRSRTLPEDVHDASSLANSSRTISIPAAARG